MDIIQKIATFIFNVFMTIGTAAMIMLIVYKIIKLL